MAQLKYLIEQSVDISGQSARVALTRNLLFKKNPFVTYFYTKMKAFLLAFGLLAVLSSLASAVPVGDQLQVDEIARQSFDNVSLIVFRI